MKKFLAEHEIRKLVKEIILRILTESEEEYDYELYDRENELKTNVLWDFLQNNNEDRTKRSPWRLIKYPVLRKIWEDYITYGHVRNIRGLEDIEDVMIENTLLLYVFNTLAGRVAGGDPAYDYEDAWGDYLNRYVRTKFKETKPDKDQLEIDFDNSTGQGYKKKEIPEEPEYTEFEGTDTHLDKFIENKYELNSDGTINTDIESISREELKKVLMEELEERFWWYYMDDGNGQPRISDFGMQPLLDLLEELRKAKSPEEKLLIIDRMLQVVHPRSDMAGNFVEGGSSALSNLSASPAEREAMAQDAA